MFGKLITGMTHNREVRIYVAETTKMVEAARATHDLSPMSTAALGRTLTAAVMMGMMSKIDNEKLTLQIKGSNDIKLMIAIADTHGHVKGYTSNPHAETRVNELKKLAVGDSIGTDGKVIVIRDYGMKEPFIGQSNLVSGEIAEDLAYYFAQSEQQPTAVGLGVYLSSDASVKSAGGFIVQLLPETKEDTIDQLEANLSGMKSITQLFEEGLTIEQIAGQVLAGLGLDELETYPLEYVCDCSREKMKSGMMSIGKTAIQEILDEDGEAELICHFCNSKYLFTEEELIELINQMEK
ncbi:MAG: Hsp33 family molecular chaperone HslO [Clostridia bacterium]|nr:Hsp33 family molecular chaperone HslO [Clostridia bacterium]